MSYLAQSFTPQENKVKCTHRYRKCDCGAVHCLGACGFWQESFGEWKVQNKEGKWVIAFSEPEPEKRAACEFHKI